MRYLLVLLAACGGSVASPLPPHDAGPDVVDAGPCVDGLTRCTPAGMQSCIWGTWSVPVVCAKRCVGGDAGCE